MISAFRFEDLDLDAWVLGPGAADEVGHGVDGEGGERGDLECAGFQFEHAADRVAGFADRSLNVPGGADQCLARGREPQAAADAVKQLHAEF